SKMARATALFRRLSEFLSYGDISLTRLAKIGGRRIPARNRKRIYVREYQRANMVIATSSNRQRSREKTEISSVPKIRTMATLPQGVWKSIEANSSILPSW